VSRRSDPVHRSILAIDIEGSTTRTNLVKLELRRQIYELLSEAMTAAGINESHREPLTDRGDGVLVLIHPLDEVPRSRLIDPLIPVLAQRLSERNAALAPSERADRGLRLRVVVHAGDILRDEYGPFGTELDVAFRLLDARVVKTRLRDSRAPLVLVISEQIFEAVVLHRYGGICPEEFRRAIRVRLCGMRRYGWIHLPHESMAAEPLQAA
jgi:class 3 adenylate cyclase